jgi:hypothetical protein
MTLPKGLVEAVYNDTGVDQYRGNPFIEALPPLLEVSQVASGLSGNLVLRPSDTYLNAQTRIHVISQLLDGFFQPLSRHIELELKISMLIRQGYVGRNLATGDLETHLQNGYERIMKGDLSAFRFDHAVSTAKSLAFIGCSGSGKTSSLNRILATYPQAIYHENYNFTQIVFLKIDCPHDGALKSLCHNFFRAIDALLSTNYVSRYAKKRHGVETLIALMAQIANTHSIGLLIIDEIQHLKLNGAGGAERMLNFFVTLVNVISIPVVMVGTPKARSVFTADLRSARRSAALGSILWEPLSKPSTSNGISKTDWGAFTNRLWKYQWLSKASSEISEETRETWYDLSQGIMDIVVKLFVLSQIRAVVTKVERITPKLMKTVYEDELKPIHPMIEALRSGEAEKIAKYSDLTIPDVDKRILELSKLLSSEKQSIDNSIDYEGNEQATRLHNMLISMNCTPDLLKPLIKRAFKEHPKLSMKDLMPIILDWYKSAESDKPKSRPPKAKLIKQKDWHTLDSNDLRFLFSQTDDADELQKSISTECLLFDSKKWVDSFV